MENVMSHEPTSLQEAIIYFSNPDNCIDYLAVRRWPEGVICPGCGSKKVSFNAKRRTWKCGSHHPKREFSVKVGTIFEDSPIPLDKWLTATWLLTNCKNGISSYEIARDLKVTQKSAWFMLHRIRLAMQDDFFGSKMSGEVEADETYIGGKSRNMHKARRVRVNVRDNNSGKTIVMGVLQRGGKVRAKVVPNRKKESLSEVIYNTVEKGSILYSDEHPAYMAFSSDYVHQVINHLEKYVDGRVHTNGMENFWSLFKRGLGGTYVAVEPFHLFRYVDEQAFRFNNRKGLDDAGRFNLAISQIVGKRLTFAALTGKVGPAANN
ncbi:MAG: IS1595 family transposase [Acidobacteriia bacterium]|nr:IS1595 family transposase [Terriglobia bacterium]